MIFNFFDPVEYNGVKITNIFKNYKKYFDEVADNFILKEYKIKGNPRPELLSHNIYGNVNHYWVILMLNNIYDPFHGWIKSQEQIHSSSIQKYKNFPDKENTVLYHRDINGNKHYRMSEYPIGSGIYYDIGDINRVAVQFVGALAPVSAIEHEMYENELKRDIKILAPNELGAFLDMLTRRMELVLNASR